MGQVALAAPIENDRHTGDEVDLKVKGVSDALDHTQGRVRVAAFDVCDVAS